MIRDLLNGLIAKCRMIFRIDWIPSLRINLSILPWHQAKHLPILLYKSQIKNIGEICIDSNDVRFGMIKLGIKHEINCMNKIGIVLDNRGKIVFRGSGIVGNGSLISVKNKGVLLFGENFGVTGDFKLHCHDSITIGKNFSSSWNVSIYDTDFHETENPLSGDKYLPTKPVRIGDNVWLCQNCTILKGAVVPNEVTIAANSLANKDYSETPKYSILAGIPAKSINKKIRRTDMYKISKLKGWYITSGLNIFNPQI